jgi:hypothetical protein
MTVLETFPPLQTAIANAESWKTYLSACEEELRSQHSQDIFAKAENSVGIGAQLGEFLPLTWRAAFHCLFRPTLAPWNSVKEFEALRQNLRGLFYTVREAMDRALKIAEMLPALTGRQPAGMERLLKAIEEARKLEENVFRDWPTFIEPLRSTNALPVDESLAEVLGITVEEARQKMNTRRHQVNAGSRR